MANTTTSSRKLEDQAATAALYVTSPKKSTSQKQHPLLDEDGKLSSAGAATSLKYAKAQDLPSFPSAGLKMSSAGAAASLAESNKSTFEHWKPGNIPAANRAALLAKDYEMDPLWQPEISSAGSRAALLAHKDTVSPEIWTSPGSKEGQSAAGQALKAKSTNKWAGHEREVPADVHQKALLAATGAMAGNRPRAGSTPVKPTDDKSWALKAATSSHKKVPVGGAFTSGDPGFEAAKIQNMAKQNVNRQLYGSAPPVNLEVQEKNRQDTLRASAVAMAQKMYAIQQSHIDQVAAGVRRSDSHAAANSSHRRNLSEDSDIASEDVPVAPRYENLEEAARKLAQARLAKLHDEHAEYRQYYGASSPPTRNRLSTRMRRRASTGSSEDSDDEVQSRKIRHQMSMFQTKLADVDKNKRQADRDALLQAAHRNVEARMAKMDKKIFEDTGKSSPAQREAWEQEAKARAQARAEVASQTAGKVHIGGGKYLDQSEIDAIARARLQPTLDDITEKAEKQRARDEEIKAEQERVKALAEKEKAREAEVKAELKATHNREKQESKAKRDEEKRLQKEQAATLKEQRKAESAAEKERARIEKEEKRKSKDTKYTGVPSTSQQVTGNQEAAPETIERQVTSETDHSADVPHVAESTAIDSAAGVSSVADDSTVHDQVTHPTEVSEQRKSIEVAPMAESATPSNALAVGPTSVPDATTEPGVPLEKRDSKVKSWFKTRLRGSSKVEKDDTTPTTTNTGANQTREESIRDVAMAGRTSETADMYGSSGVAAVSPVPGTAAVSAANRSPSISSLSSSDLEEASRGRSSVDKPTSGNAGRTGLKNKLFKRIRPSKEEESSSNKLEAANTTDDEFEEARDTFEEKLSPPATHAGERTRSSHGESKFTEEL